MKNKLLQFVRRTKIPHASLVRETAAVAEPNLFKISQKRQSSSQSEHASIPATRCLGSIGHLFLCSLFFGRLSSPSARRGEVCTHLAKPKKAPVRFLDRVAKMYLFWRTRGTHILARLCRSNYQPLHNK